jgi:glucose-6-phosphate isomerase
MLLVANKGMDYNFNSDLPVRMHFLSNTDPDSFKLLMDKLNLKTTIMVNMSKSGSTAETKGNMDAFNELLEKNKIEKKGKHNIAITTPDSKFDIYAKEKEFMNIFYMNNETGLEF